VEAWPVVGKRGKGEREPPSLSPLRRERKEERTCGRNSSRDGSRYGKEKITHAGKRKKKGGGMSYSNT